MHKIRYYSYQKTFNYLGQVQNIDQRRPQANEMDTGVFQHRNQEGQHYKQGWGLHILLTIYIPILSKLSKHHLTNLRWS